MSESWHCSHRHFCSSYGVSPAPSAGTQRKDRVGSTSFVALDAGPTTSCARPGLATRTKYRRLPNNQRGRGLQPVENYQGELNEYHSERGPTCIADCWHSDFDSAALAELHCRNLPHHHWTARSLRRKRLPSPVTRSVTPACPRDTPRTRYQELWTKCFGLSSGFAGELRRSLRWKSTAVPLELRLQSRRRSSVPVRQITGYR